MSTQSAEPATKPILLTPAKYAAIPIQFHSERVLQQAAECEYNGIRLFSKAPESAAEAERINRALRGD